MNIEFSSMFDSFEQFYLYHAILSTMIGIIAVFFLQKRYKSSKISMLLFVLMFNIAIPIVGYFLTILIVYYLLTVQYDKVLSHIKYINMIDFENQFPEVTRSFGEGQMNFLLFDDEVPKAMKMKALVSLSDNPSRDQIKLIKNSLSDKNDEVRLYSFAMIDTQEKIISEKIHEHIEFFNKAKSSKEKIKAAIALVYLYSDMMYLELASIDIKDFYIQEIERYADFVFELDPENNKINVVLGKLYLAEKNFDKAQYYFSLAIKKEKNKDFIIPYLAEIHYHNRDFFETKALLSMTEDLYYNTMLNPIVQQWSSK